MSGNDTTAKGRMPAIAVWGAIALLLGAAFWWTGHWLVERWEAPSSYYSHGWLVPPVVLFLLWRRRDALKAAPVQPTAWGLALLLPSLLVHLMGTAWQVGFLSGFALIGTLAGVTLSLFGWQVLRIALFPLAFLVFMVPVPVLLVEMASFRLKMLAARFAVGTVALFGVPIIREGSYVTVPNGTVVVDDVCSGLKYLISLTAFGALYSYIAKVKPWQRVSLFALAIPVAFLANVIRVTLMISAAHVWSVEATEEWFFHDLFGFLLFGVAFTILFVAESLFLKMDPLPQKAEEPEELPSGASPARRTPALPGFRRPAVFAVAALSLALTAGASLYLSWPRNVPSASETLKSMPLQIGQWRGREIELSERTYEILGTRDVLSRLYRDPEGRQVQFVVVMARQARRRTHPPEQCFTGEGYEIAESKVRPTDVRFLGEPLKVRELILERNRRERVAWYFYKSGETTTTSYWLHQAGVALRKLRNPSAADVLVRVDATAPAGESHRARARLEEFLAAAADTLAAELP